MTLNRTFRFGQLFCMGAFVLMAVFSALSGQGPGPLLIALGPAVMFWLELNRSETFLHAFVPALEKLAGRLGGRVAPVGGAFPEVTVAHRREGRPAVLEVHLDHVHRRNWWTEWNGRAFAVVRVGGHLQLHGRPVTVLTGIRDFVGFGPPEIDSLTIDEWMRFDDAGDAARYLTGARRRALITCLAAAPDVVKRCTLEVADGELMLGCAFKIYDLEASAAGVVDWLERSLDGLLAAFGEPLAVASAPSPSPEADTAPMPEPVRALRGEDDLGRRLVARAECCTCHLAVRFSAVTCAGCGGACHADCREGGACGARAA